MSATVESLIRELRAAGLPVASLSELVNTKQSYPEAVPLLLRWLDGLEASYLNREQPSVELAVRALAVPSARGVAAPRLIDLFRSVQDQTGMGIRWAIGNTLEVVGDDSVADDLVELATNKQYGPARQMVVVGLSRLRSDRVERVLIDLLNDDDVAGHAAIALGKRRSHLAVPALTGLLHHSKPWVRKEAKKALARIQS